MTEPDPAIRDSLDRLGLIRGGAARFTPLAGGVSSDIWKVETAAGTVCVKRALAKLKVEADWRVPVERNRYEVAWYRVVHRILPEAVPEILADDPQAGLCVMSWLDPADHALWKTQLRDGHADPATAAELGRRLARIHGATADDGEIAALFPRRDIFHAIRLEPYLERTALAHPDLKDILYGLSARTAALSRIMIHGDVSPKNILVGPGGPIFIDAECACLGDPAFDLAFCLNHMLLKCLWTPAARDAFLACFDALADSYLAGVDWEPPGDLEFRAASLLPGLFLARVDGASPVEYVTREADKDRIRRVARPLLQSPPARLAQIRHAWREELAS